MKLRLTLLFLILVLILSACGGSGEIEADTDNSEDSSETVEIRLGHVTQTTHPYHLAAEHFAEQVEKESDGNIQIEIYPSRQLGGDVEMLEMLQNGSLEAGFISSSVFSGSTPVMDGLQLPFLLDSYEVFGQAIQSETADKMLDRLEEINLKGLGINESGMRHMGSNISPIQTPEDLDGLSIRVAESPLMQSIFSTLGADPTSMAYGEIYSALQTDVIDAHESDLSAYVAENFYEVTDYITLTKHFPWPNINVFNLDFYESLSEENQQILEKAGEETQMWILERLVDLDEEALQELNNEGVHVEELEDISSFRDKVQPVYEEYAEKDPLIEEFISTVEEIKSDQ
ncbi:TRAP transporter substrate-binding protein [Alteribacillus sp. YIM 98480]|uniref:TRAP transporter substrate-binding protein n=1 Tax=Alteribacillus sp. YIM 98480 TaxID=2606599 RepID=UPI00131B0798|nr:TRAP transporter substrate-binding protein [Alteribacillus sp. YIM 98480]